MIFARLHHDITSQFWGSGSLRGASDQPAWHQQSAEQKIVTTKSRSWLAALVTLLCLAAISAAIAGAQPTPRNIILFIGDGMGVAHITAAKTVNSQLHLEQFRTAGLLTTHSHNAYITESGAAATALATTRKSLRNSNAPSEFSHTPVRHPSTVSVTS